MSFRVRVDLTNPGQFFACCGLFELASRLTGEATARFDGAHFSVESECTLGVLMGRFTGTPLQPLDSNDETASPLYLPAPFNLLLDWWKDQVAGGRELKVWAGTMQSTRIEQAMIAALRDPALHTDALLDVSCVVYDPEEPTKKVEPFYFDARRAPNAHSRDVGFSPNDLDMTTAAFPAVEALCLIGLQRFRPRPIARRTFEYRSWSTPVAPVVAAPVVCSHVPVPHTSAYRFEAWFRTGQKKHKAFRPAVPVS